MTHSMIAVLAIAGGIAAFILLVAMIAAGAKHRRPGNGSSEGTSAWMFTDNSSNDGGHHSGHHGGHDGGGHSGGGFDGGGGGGHGGH